MPVVIRLSRTGKKGERKFRIVVKEKRGKRDGVAIDTLGWYEKTEKEEKRKIDQEKYNAWIAKGAKPTESVKKILQS